MIASETFAPRHPMRVAAPLVQVRDQERAFDANRIKGLLTSWGVCLNAYPLPGRPGDQHILPVSGGADSTAMAILMCALFPRTEFTLMFTDTGAEADSLYDSLDRLEAYLGRPITRLAAERTLGELIKHYNGYLPSSRSRYCTRELKLVPFEAFMEKIRISAEKVWSYVGVRADESERIGLVSHRDWIETEMPFKDLGIGRDLVFKLLDATIGVPALYRTRTRSGCVCCPFQRKSELVGQYLESGDAHAFGASVEKPSSEERERFSDPVLSLTKETGTAANWMGLPVPPQIDARTAATATAHTWAKRPRKKACRHDDLFALEQGGNTGLWVGAEFLVNGDVGGSGVWQQRIVTYSSTRAGLKRQLQSHFEHRVGTPEVFGIDQETMRRELKLAMYYIEVPDGLMDVEPSRGGFLWQKGDSYLRRQHLVSWAQRVLQAAGMKQWHGSLSPTHELGIEWEWKQSTGQCLAKIDLTVGDVLEMGEFVPDANKKTETPERLVACFHCSL